MGLLYEQYASPMDLIKMYINRGRFGEFVASVLEADYQRRKDEAEKDDNWKLWTMYIQLVSVGATDESFAVWKERVCKPATENSAKGKSSDEELTEDGIKSIIDRLFPNDNNQG